MLRTASALVVCALLAGGCGAAHHAAAPGRRATTRPASPSPTPTPTPTALPAARNGTDVSACTTGRCEVRVSKPVHLQMDCCGLATMTITVGSDGVDFDAIADDGTRVDAMGQLPGPKPSVTNGLSLWVMGFNGHAAVIKLSR